jgi:hypothetical protein
MAKGHRYGWNSGIAKGRDFEIYHSSLNRGSRKLPDRLIIAERFASLGAGSVGEFAFFRAPYKCRVLRAGVVTDAAVTGAATNNFGLRFKNKGSAGAGTGVIATLTFASGTDATAYDDKSLGAVAEAQEVLSEGDTASFEKFENGTGMSQPALVAYLEIERITSGEELSSS